MQIVMPKLNDAGDDGQVDELLVAVGDEVGVGDAVMTVEMEKAVIEIESLHAGRVKHIIVAPGDIVAIGQPLMDLE
jgi:pyruvate/2-oxoglutarate dehydrogenase complex dihydrolipoamide acyltransferase (E2) component